MGDLVHVVLPCLVVGGLLGWRWPSRLGWLAPVLIHWGVPLSLAGLLLRASPSATLLKVGILAGLVPLLCLGLFLGCSPLRHRLGHRVMILGAAVGNTGYWGVPVALALLPPESLPTAVMYDVAGTLVTWSVGPLLLLGVQASVQKQMSAFLSSPALKGCALWLLIGQSPWKHAFAAVLWWPARAVFAMALVLLGMRLGETIRGATFTLSPGLCWAVGWKLLGVPAVVWLLAHGLALPDLDRQALVLQGAAPTALSVLLIAEAEPHAGAMASSLVLTSTLLAIVTVPFWWGVMLR